MSPIKSRPKYFVGYVTGAFHDNDGVYIIDNAHVYSARTETSASEELEVCRVDVRLPSLDFGPDDFVIGCIPGNKACFVFRNPLFDDPPGRITIPVQVLPWDSFEESSATPSAAEYLKQTPYGELSFKYDSLMGKKEHPGSVILLDVTSHSIFKGFSAIGNRRVQFDDVMRYNGNIVRDAIHNERKPGESDFSHYSNIFSNIFDEIKIVTGKFEESEFCLWIPDQYNSFAKDGKHPVLDKEGWCPFFTKKMPVAEVLFPTKEDLLETAVQAEAASATTASPGNGKPAFPEAGTPLPSQPETASRDKSNSPATSSGEKTLEVSAIENPLESEIAFLERFVEYTLRCGFAYSSRDLVRFHTSVKCGMCTLLAGEPGMGKSSLAELYFRALGGEKQNQEKDESFLRVDVNPSWMEPADLLGYQTNEGFHPAANGLCEFLQRAACQTSLLFPICLEEINLACVEHYFSDFIQILSRGHGTIKYAGENGDLTVGENIRFVGTCNSDETTHSMSPRFLDRCHLIELVEEKDVQGKDDSTPSKNKNTDPQDTKAEKRIKATFEKGAAMPQPHPFTGGGPVTWDEFKAWQETRAETEVPKESIEKFASLFDNFIEAEIHVSPRVIWEIVRYVRQRPLVGDFKDGKFKRVADCSMMALDEGIAQRVLSLYRASPSAHKGLQELKNHLEDFPLSADIAERRCNEFVKTIDY